MNKKKEEHVEKAKQGKAEWEEELASDSESMVWIDTFQHWFSGEPMLNQPSSGANTLYRSRQTEATTGTRSRISRRCKRRLPS